MGCKPETPQRKARREIDADLAAAGWVVQDRDEIDITARRGVALRDCASAFYLRRLFDRATDPDACATIFKFDKLMPRGTAPC